MYWVGLFVLGGIAMINLDEIEREIYDLEARGETTYSLCERLAWLYIVRDHIKDGRSGVASLSGNKTGQLSGSEFMEACSNIDFAELMAILDEHMSAVRVIAPKEYDSVVRKIRDAAYRNDSTWQLVL